MTEIQRPIIKHDVPIPIECYGPQYHVLRRSKLIVMLDCLAQYDKFNAKLIKQRQNLVCKLERACYNHTIDKAQEENIITSWDVELFCDLYTSICAKIIANIDKTGTVANTELAQWIIDETINIYDIPKMSSQELFPSKYREVMKRVELSKNVNLTKKTSALYRCPKCHMSECSIENRYNRSLDEGVNLSITCLNCGKEWNA